MATHIGLSHRCMRYSGQYPYSRNHAIWDARWVVSSRCNCALPLVSARPVHNKHGPNPVHDAGMGRFSLSTFCWNRLSSGIRLALPIVTVRSRNRQPQLCINPCRIGSMVRAIVLPQEHLNSHSRPRLPPDPTSRTAVSLPYVWPVISTRPLTLPRAR
jgi:hypothetical protein